MSDRLSGDRRSASLLENARFNALVIVPNALQGVFRRRRAAVAAATARRTSTGRRSGCSRGMRRGHGGGPVWVRVIRDRALLLLTPADVHRALEGSPDPFASDPKPKRDGMVAFQPDALTISRGETWRKRRAFNEAVLDTGRPLHRLGERFAAVAARGGRGAASAGAAEAAELSWDAWNDAFRRITRRVVLGDARAPTTSELSETLAEMMSEANGMPGKTSARYPGFIARLGEYVAAAEPGSLVGRVRRGARPTPRPSRSARSRTGCSPPATPWRSTPSAPWPLIASHPRAAAPSSTAELEASAGLPTSRAASRRRCGCGRRRRCSRARRSPRPSGAGRSVPAGTQVLIPNTFLHRDRERHEWADRFAPERWVDGEAAGDWSFNHFSRGPQGCPGAALALLLGTAVLATVLRAGPVELASPSLDPAKPLPHMLDFFGLRFRL